MSIHFVGAYMDKTFDLVRFRGLKEHVCAQNIVLREINGILKRIVWIGFILFGLFVYATYMAVACFVALSATFASVSHRDTYRRVIVPQNEVPCQWHAPRLRAPKFLRTKYSPILHNKGYKVGIILNQYSDPCAYKCEFILPRQK